MRTSYGRVSILRRELPYAYNVRTYVSTLVPHDRPTVLGHTPSQQPVLRFPVVRSFSPSRLDMGNLCGKESSDPFAQPGRTLGSAPPPSEGTSRLPAGVSSTVGGPGHTLGGSGPSATDDARRAAALAAEVL